MAKNRIYRKYDCRIVIGIMILAIILITGEASAVWSTESITAIKSDSVINTHDLAQKTLKERILLLLGDLIRSEKVVENWPVNTENKIDLSQKFNDANIISISIDVNPRCINPERRGVIKVTIHNSSAFDISRVNISSVRFGPGEAAIIKSNYADDKKLLLFFDFRDTGIGAGDTTATLTGKTIDGLDIIGTGTIRTKDDGEDCEKFPSPLSIFTISGSKINGTDNVNTPLQNWKIFLVNSTTGLEIKNTTTNNSGFYNFTGLSNGTYNVTEEMQTGWENISAMNRIVTIDGNNITDVTFINRIVQIPFSVIITSVGNSGCGRNVNTKEDITNVKQYEYSREEYVHTSKGTMVFSFITLGLISEAGFNPKTNEGCITALGEILKGRPSQSASDIPGAIYFNVWVGPWGYSESSKVENPYIIFNVPDEKNNEIVKLMMYKDGSWTDLKTEELGGGVYKAYTMGFGSFAIVKTPEAPPETLTPESTPPAVTGEQIPSKPINWFWIIGIIILISIVLAMIYLMRKSP